MMSSMVRENFGILEKIFSIQEILSPEKGMDMEFI